MSMDPSASVTQNLQFLRGQQFVTYWDVGAGALLVYDFFLTLPREITYVWPSPWLSAGKILFLLTRYMPFLDIAVVSAGHFVPSIGDLACHQIYSATGWLFALGIGVAEIVLIMRTWALWGQRRRIAVILVVIFVIVYIPVGVCLQIYLNTVTFAPSPAPTVLTGCFVSYNNPILFGTFALLMVYETFIVIMTLVKGVQQYRQNKHVSSNLVITLYRDGVLFYVYLVALSVGNVIVLILVSSNYSTFLTTIQRILHSLLSARILLNIRQATSRRVEGTGISSSAATPSSVPTIAFEAPPESRGNMNPTESKLWFGDGGGPGGTISVVQPEENSDDHDVVNATTIEEIELSEMPSSSPRETDMPDYGRIE